MRRKRRTCHEWVKSYETFSKMFLFLVITPLKQELKIGKTNIQEIYFCVKSNVSKIVIFEINITIYIRKDYHVIQMFSILPKYRISNL